MKYYFSNEIHGPCPLLASKVKSKEPFFVINFLFILNFSWNFSQNLNHDFFKDFYCLDQLMTKRSPKSIYTAGIALTIAKKLQKTAVATFQNKVGTYFARAILTAYSVSLQFLAIEVKIGVYRGKILRKIQQFRFQPLFFSLN